MDILKGLLRLGSYFDSRSMPDLANRVDELAHLTWTERFASGPTSAKTAVIIKGNPEWVDGPHKEMADRFYGEISYVLEGLGYAVKMDAGEPYTSPPHADIWIGHSRGVDRLQGADGIDTIGLGVPSGEYEFPTINHPGDDPAPGKLPSAEHYMFTPEMHRAIVEIAKKQMKQ